MAKLKWKQSRDSWKEQEARASSGSRYRIYRYDQGFVVSYCPPKRRWWPQVGTVATYQEAIALAEAHNDKKLAAAEAA
jgi:hypothetical protein